MMFKYPVFDVEVARKINFDDLRWPERGEAADEQGLGCNRSYMDMRGISWTTARAVFAEEAELISKIEAAAEPAEFYSDIEDEGLAGIDGIDVGVASTVFSLSAARCIPFSSCNGGVFGGHHAEVHPVVAFFSRPPIAALLLECAEEAQSGLCNSADCLLAYADDIRAMTRFAAAITSRSKAFRKIRIGPFGQRPRLSAFRY
jgi:hypothetical protein